MKEFGSLNRKKMTTEEKNVLWSKVQFYTRTHTNTHLINHVRKTMSKFIFIIRYHNRFILDGSCTEKKYF